MICASAGSKSRLAKAAGAEVAAQSRQEKWHAAAARSTFARQNAKKTRCRSTFGSPHVQKWHAAVARSTFASQNVQNTSARRIFGSLGVENWNAAVARSTFASQNVKNIRGPAHFLKCGCRKIAKKWHAAVAPSAFTSQNVKTLAFCTTFRGF